MTTTSFASNRYASPLQRWLACIGAVTCGAAVALSAYAAHAVAGKARSSLQTAAIVAFSHGLALATLTRGAQRRLALVALAALLLGTLLFSGGLVLAHVAGVPAARTAPFGGTLLIAAWLLYAIDTLRG